MALPALLNTLTPAQLLEARHVIDALLTPQVLRQANHQLSPLLRLPRNVLQRIINYAVSRDGLVVAEDTSKGPGLLQTCYALRLVASKAYFSQNTFKRKRYTQDESLERWAKVRVGENRRHIGGVRVGWPLHCSNEEAKIEAGRIEDMCGFPSGTVWCLSEDDFENDHQWWVNGIGQTEICVAVASNPAPSTLAIHRRDAAESVRPQPSWYCSSWAMGGNHPDYFGLPRGPPTPESRPSAQEAQ